MKISATCIVALALTCTLPVSAEDSYVIRYSATELLTTKGMDSVLQRIRSAAKDYCPTYLEIRSHTDVRNCVDSVVADLVEKVGYPAFTRYVSDQPTTLTAGN